MEKKKVWAGICGSGFSAAFHFDAMQRVYGVEVEVGGVWSPTFANAEKFAKERGIKVFKTLDELINANDVIHVCTATVGHEKAAIAALKKNKYAIVEKPFTGFFGDGSDDFDGRKYPKEKMLEFAQESIERMLQAEAESDACILYAENWVYCPSIQKEREIIEKTGAQILWIHGEEAHSGSHSPTYGFWKYSGGGSLIGKGVHPLTGALYLKRVEGRARDGKPIRPASISARTHNLTRIDNFRDEGHLRTDYFDTEDFSIMHITFEDGSIADIFASEIVMGGIHNWLEVVANNHRTTCNINPNSAMQTYNPVDANFKDIYTVEKTGTKQGWSNPSPDEDFFTGYPQEIEAFYQTVAHGAPVEGDSRLAADTISTVYSGYVSAEQNGAEVKIKAY